MPGSKSHANRAIICACLAKGTTTITNATPCDDVALLVKNLQKMGFDIRYTSCRSGELKIKGGVPKNTNTKFVVLNCSNAGTTLRFLTSLACIVPEKFKITGNEAMKKRPIGDLVKALKNLGADVESNNGFPPIKVGSKTISGGTADLDASKSSQYLTSLLLCAPLLENLKINLSHFVASMPYVLLTNKVQKDFGIKFGNQFDITKNTISLKRQQYTPPSANSYPIEGDWSAYGAFLVLAKLTDSNIEGRNLSRNSMQGDSYMCKIVDRLNKKGDISIDCIDIPDQVMNLAVFAAFRNGTTKIIHVQNLRYKECDRLAVITNELTKAGVDIEEHPDHLLIKGLKKLPSKKVTLDPHDDHRMVMAFAVLGCLRPGITIKNPECVSKSYPDFFRDLEKLHKSSRCISIIGMRGGGKTTLARKLAKKLSLKHIDTDDVIEQKNGKINALVKKCGWNMFREKEEIAVRQSINPGRVVSLGGGAIESKGTCELLEKKSIVIYLKEPASIIINRLKKKKRPPLTGLPLEREVKEIMKKRSPIYRRLADITVSSSDEVSGVIDSLSKLCSL